MGVVWKTIKWVVIVVVVLGLGLVGLNAFDEKPDPQAQRMLQPVEEVVPPQANLLYALIGFNRPGDDWSAAGLAARRRADAAIRAGRSANDAADDLNAELKRDALVLKGDSKLLPEQSGSLEDILKRMQERHQEVHDLLSNNRWMLERYNSLYQYERYANTLAPGAMFITLMPVGSLNDARRLWILDWARAVEAGRLDEAANRLRDDARFWRRMLAQPDMGLIDKMVMVAWIRADFRLGSQLVHAQKLSAQQLDVLREMATPITAAERSLEGVLRGETRWIDATVIQSGLTSDLFRTEVTPADMERKRSWIERVGDHMTRHFFQHQAFVNRHARAIQRAIEFDSRPCEQYLSQSAEGADSGVPGGWWSLPYDPTGKLLFMVADPSTIYRSYTGRMCDLVGFQRVLALQLELRRQNIADADIAQFVQKAGAAYANPFTGQPLQWLPKERSLTFGAVDKRDSTFLPWPI